MFSQEERCHYRKSPLFSVICQVRFPEILTIETTLPDRFQEAIRRDYPRYSLRQENAAPKIVGTPGNLSLENPPAVKNYQFVSQDGIWRVNLTSRFLSLTCVRYPGWEEFARRIDKPLAALIQIYQPSYFERAGLRYLNFFSRQQLGLEGVPFRELFEAPYLGVLADPEVSEASASQCTVETEMAVRGGCRVRLHAGPGYVKTPGGQQNPEVKFIFDQDLFMPGNIPVNLSAPALATLHSQAWAVFRGAYTDRTHRAMEPEIL